MVQILLLSQWFQPEPHFKGLPLAQALADLGHEVEVLTGFPNYPGGRLYPGYRVKLWQREQMGAVGVTRAPLYPSHDRSAIKRIANYVSFAVSSTLLALTRPRPDVVYVYCPPMTAAAAAVILRFLRRVPYVVDIQDLWPDTLASTGMVKNGLIMRMVGAWSNFAMRHAERLVVLSPGFKRRLVDRGIAVPIDVIPNWAPPEIERLMIAPFSAVRECGIFNVLFAGNMGQAQALTTVLDAAALLLGDPSIRFTFIGGGVQVEELKKLANKRDLANVTFLPSRPAEEMMDVFADADALLVHLRDDPLFAITIPSKTQAYLAAGKPILMGVLGDAAAMVEQAGAGLIYEPENAKALAEAVVKLSRLSPAERQQMGERGQAFYRAQLSFGVNLPKIAKVLSLAAKSAA